jgi:endonuclease/exonuclease/phosphatase family metal-dependent hydrolase
LLGIALVVLGLGQSPQGPAPRARTGDVRVMTYNIKHGQTNAPCTQQAAMPGQPPAPDCNLDLQAAVAVIREHDPDLIGLQEVDRFWARSGYQDEPAVLSAALGMEHLCYAANLDHPADNHADRPHQYGTLVLSRFPIRTCSNTPLPRTGENEQRGFTLAVIDVRGVTLRFYNTHLHTTEADRLLQTEAIAQAIGAASAGAKVVVGDLNARPTATELEPLFARFTDSWAKAGVAGVENPNGLTSPATLGGDPRNRIDYVLVSSPVEVRAATVPIDAKTRLAADHYPVVVDLTLPTAPSAAAPIPVRVARIWDAGAHNAFTDLIRWRNRWYCTFRESAERNDAAVHAGRRDGGAGAPGDRSSTLPDRASGVGEPLELHARPQPLACGARKRQRAGAGGRHGKHATRRSVRAVGTCRRHEALGLQAIERDVDGADGDVAAGDLRELPAHVHAVGVMAGADDGQHDLLLERAEQRRFRFAS